MKDFKKFLEEITIKGNPGIPGEDPNKPDENPYLRDVEGRAKRRMNIRPEDVSQNRPSMREMQLGRRLMELLNKSRSFTKNHEDELSELAERVFRNLYQELMDRYKIGLDVKIIEPGMVKPWMDSNSSSSDSSMPPPPEFRRITENDIKNEVYKRKLANLIIQGEAKNTKHILHSDEVKDGLIDIYGVRTSREVFSILDEMSKTADQLDWIIPIDVRSDMMEKMPDGMAGASFVDWEEPEEYEVAEPLEDYEDDGQDEENNEPDDDEDTSESLPTPVIRARGLDFPMLLHEMVKGLFELLSLGGIPEDKRTAEIALSNTGIDDEPEDWRYGPEIASDLRDFVNLNDKISKYPNVREELYKLLIDRRTMPTAEFLKLMKGILSKSPEARVKIDELIDRVVNKIESDKEALDRYNREMEEYNRQMAEYDEKKSKENRVNWYDSFDDEEEQNIPEEEDYSKMRKADIQKIIDDALDKGDYDKVKRLTKYLESKTVNFSRKINESNRKIR